MMQEFATQKEVAQSARVSVDTLKRLRDTGGGPPWIRVGVSVRYPVDGLRRWVAEQVEQAS